MKKELKQRWIEALRSGEFKQGRRRLKHGNQHGTRYCCLGVLRDVAKPGDKRSLSGTQLVPWQARSYGLSMPTAGLLACKNDDGESFTEIADWIEAHIPED